MLPDQDIFSNIVQQVASALASIVDHVSYDEGGPILIVQDGFWIELQPVALDNGEES